MTRKAKATSGRKPSWENRIEMALGLGQFVSWREISEFTESLGGLLTELVSFARGRPQAALPLFEILIAGCLEKGNEIDDSGGHFGGFLDEAACAWCRCSADAGMKPNEFVRKLARWVEVDPIGFFSDLESTIVPALGREFRSALEKSLLARLDALSKETPETAGREQHKIDYARSRAIETLKKLYAETKNTTELISLCERHGLEQKDCLDLGSVFFSRKRFDSALAWVERGLNLKEDRHAREYELKRLRRKILKSAGRGSDALADAWSEFEKHPSIHSFEDVLASGPKREHAGLKTRALAIFDRSELPTAAVALDQLKEWDRLAARLTGEEDTALQSIFYGHAIPMAEALSRKHPKQAARLFIAQALEILGEKRSKAYHHAHDYLQSAKSLLERCGEALAWSSVVTAIRHDHRLKSSFMPGFEQIVAGGGSPREPTFRERIAGRLDGGSP